MLGLSVPFSSDLYVLIYLKLKFVQEETDFPKVNF